MRKLSVFCLSVVCGAAQATGNTFGIENWRLATKKILVLASIGFTLIVHNNNVKAGIIYSTAGSTYTENFDTLSGSSWTNDSTLNGWNLFRVTSNVDATPVAITAISSVTTLGGAPAGSFYNFASVGSPSDRALGGLGSGGAYFGSPSTGNVAGWIATNIVNNTGSTLTSFTVTYNGEQWYKHNNANTNTMLTEYGFGSTFNGVATWTSLGANFPGPIAGATTGAYLDGNAVANRITNITSTITTPWTAGSTLWIRYVERNDTGNDHGLALDDFRFTAIPEPSALLLVGSSIGVVLLRRRK